MSSRRIAELHKVSTLSRAERAELEFELARDRVALELDERLTRACSGDLEQVAGVRRLIADGRRHG